MLIILRYSIPCLLALSSCNKEEEGPDPALLTQFESNKLELEKLELTVEVAKKKLARNQVEDATPELETLKEKVESERERKIALEAEIRSLEAAKEKAARDLAEYKREYPVRQP